MLPRGSVVTPKRKVVRIKNEDSDNDVDEIRLPKKSNMQSTNLVSEKCTDRCVHVLQLMTPHHLCVCR